MPQDVPEHFREDKERIGRDSDLEPARLPAQDRLRARRGTIGPDGAGLLGGQRRYFQKSSTTSGFSLKIQASANFPSLMWAMWV